VASQFDKFSELVAIKTKMICQWLSEMRRANAAFAIVERSLFDGLRSLFLPFFVNKNRRLNISFVYKPFASRGFLSHYGMANTICIKTSGALSCMLFAFDLNPHSILTFVFCVIASFLHMDRWF
jgi:hypothetical protein